MSEDDERAYKDSDDLLATLERRLGHTFAHRQLLVDALTHRSYAYEFAAPGVVNNERLEFLGDAVLALMSADLLFARYAQADEGMLTQYRAALVQAATLARFAEALELGPYLRLGRGEDAIGGRARTPLLAAAFEAVLGALYLDGGMAVARAFLEPYSAGRTGAHRGGRRGAAHQGRQVAFAGAIAGRARSDATLPTAGGVRPIARPHVRRTGADR